MNSPSPPREPDAPAAGPVVQRSAGDVRAAGRGGVAILAAKVYFVLIGLIQQIALKAVLGLGGYGAYSSAQAVASIAYNPVVQASIQGVSRTLAAAEPKQRPQLLRQTLRLHTFAAAGLGMAFFALAQPVASFLGATHLTNSLRILSLVVLVYGIYAPLIGALNGQKRFVSQATLDVAAATLRTAGLLLGAWLFVRAQGQAVGAVDSANLGFVVASVVILLTALGIAGAGRRGPKTLTAAEYAAFTLPVLGGQLLLNVLFQADSLLVRRFLAEAALGQGLGPEAADPLVGAYRAAQMFCFLPYQLLMSVTFVLFPLLAEAKGRGQPEEVKRLVRGGLRLGTLAMGAMLSVLVANPFGLIALVYGRDAATLGAPALRPLALGLSAFALVGLITSAQNSLGKPGASLKLTGIATALVLSFGFAAGYRGQLDSALLVHMAGATCAALVLTLAIAQGMLRRHAGAALDLGSLLKVLVAAAVAAGITDVATGALGRGGKLVTLAGSMLALVVYGLMLAVLREFGSRELTQLRALLGLKG